MATDTKTSPWPVLDLRPISAEADRMITTVTIEDFDIGGRARHDWLTFGEASLATVPRNGHTLQGWQLKGWIARHATDESHDAAQIIRLPLIGVTLSMVHQHRTWIEALIDPSLDERSAKTEFRVPPPGWDPFAKGITCKACRDKERKGHPITPYLPPHDPKLWALMRGKRVSILMGAAVQPYRHASGGPS